MNGMEGLDKRFALAYESTRTLLIAIPETQKYGYR